MQYSIIGFVVIAMLATLTTNSANAGRKSGCVCQVEKTGETGNNCCISDSAEIDCCNCGKKGDTAGVGCCNCDQKGDTAGVGCCNCGQVGDTAGVGCCNCGHKGNTKGLACCTLF